MDLECHLCENDSLLNISFDLGTLGLTVTYCCRGEEENMMMKIAQKCNINLLPLPGTFVSFIFLL
jgi:hypothetical protein